MGFLASTLALSALLILFTSPSIAQRPKALVLPVTKDSTTGQYTTQISQRTPLVPVKLTVDLGGEYLWVDCEHGYVSSSFKPVLCRSAQCSLSGSKACGDCFAGPKPGCNNNTCGLLPGNSVIGLGTSGELSQDVVSLKSTEGSNPGHDVSVPKILFTCGATFLLEGLANEVKGMAGLGRGKVGLPSQLASAFSFPKKFAVCLGTKNGVIFFGESAYNFLPGKDISMSLAYTPLLINPVSTAGAYFDGEKSVEYFVGVKSIRVNGKSITMNSTMLAISKEGRGGTKISTVNAYTVLESSIYNTLVQAFSAAFAKVPKVKSVAPFGLCFNSSSLGSTRVGPPAPTVDFVFHRPSVFWRIFGVNSMVQVKKDVLCLGFVDGGVDPRTSIVIGGHQIEDNLLQFDIATSRLGFSSTLLSQQTTCSNFNFTSV